MTRRARHIAIGIDRPFAEVYGFLAEPANFPKWAEGLGHSFVPLGGLDWRAETPMGNMTVRFTAPNPFGVVDHSVIPDGGEAMANPMRVVPNGEGSEVVFTLFQRQDMSDDEFERDAAWIEKDFRMLKGLLESLS